MTVATFCGHADSVQTKELRDWLMKVAQSLIAGGIDTFYLGGYGAFDRLAASVMREMKKSYSYISVVLVLAYLNRETDTSGYDYTFYPGLEDVPKRFAISERNKRMVDLSDVVVAYVTHDWGGAAKTLEYAVRKEKTIIRYSK